MEAGPFLRQCSTLFPNLELVPGEVAPDGRIASRLVDEVGAIRIECSPLVGRASRARALSSDLAGRCKIVWQLEGASIYRDDHDAVRVSAGDAIVVPLGVPYMLDVLPGYRTVMLIVSMRHVSPGGRLDENVSRLVSGNPAMEAAGSVVGCLLDHRDGDAHGPLLVRTALDLVYGALTAGPAMQGEPAGRAVRRARRYIRARLGDRYTPLDLAHDLGMSRRALYAALAAEGETPARLIRRVRLEHAHWSVLDDRQADLSLAEIAQRNGLNDGASLSRAFRTAYGVTPSAARRARVAVVS